jgi:hypothetical protein
MFIGTIKKRGLDESSPYMNDESSPYMKENGACPHLRGVYYERNH